MDDSGGDYDDGYSDAYDEGYEEGYAAAQDSESQQLNALARPLVILSGVSMLAGMGVLGLIMLKILPWSSRWWGYGLMAAGVLGIWFVGYGLPGSS